MTIGTDNQTFANFYLGFGPVSVDALGYRTLLYGRVGVMEIQTTWVVLVTEGATAHLLI
jgi:hypothetical protein